MVSQSDGILLRTNVVKQFVTPASSFLSQQPDGLALRTNLLKIVLPVLLLGLPVVHADEPPRASAKVDMKVSFNREPAKSLSIDLYGREAPESTKRFISWCSGENSIVSSGGNSFSYDGSLVSKVVKGEEIEIGKFKGGSGKKLATTMSDSGKVSMGSIDLASTEVPPTSDVGTLKNRRGSLSLPRAGQTFAFSLSPSENNDSLDKKNVVIGQVTNEEGMEVIRKANTVPVSREDPLGTKNAFSSAGKGFDPRAKLATVNRPLQRIEITDCRVSEKASLAGFLGGD